VDPVPWLLPGLPRLGQIASPQQAPQRSNSCPRPGSARPGRLQTARRCLGPLSRARLLCSCCPQHRCQPARLVAPWSCGRARQCPHEEQAPGHVRMMCGVDGAVNTKVRVHQLPLVDPKEHTDEYWDATRSCDTHSPGPIGSWPQCALSSGEERHLDTVEVGGSSPPARTTSSSPSPSYLRISLRTRPSRPGGMSAPASCRSVGVMSAIWASLGLAPAATAGPAAMKMPSGR
jgi:hypothetical protein